MMRDDQERLGLGRSTENDRRLVKDLPMEERVSVSMDTFEARLAGRIEAVMTEEVSAKTRQRRGKILKRVMEKLGALEGLDAASKPSALTGSA